MTLIRSHDPGAIGQTVRIHQPLRVARCAEVDCVLYLHGATFVKRGDQLNAEARAHLTPVSFENGVALYIIHHAAGTECGPRCPNEYCPCAPYNGWPGEGGYPHHVPDERVGLGYGVALSNATGQVVSRGRVGSGEALDRIGEGVEAVRHARQRGL